MCAHALLATLKASAIGQRIALLYFAARWQCRGYRRLQQLFWLGRCGLFRRCLCRLRRIVQTWQRTGWTRWQGLCRDRKACHQPGEEESALVHGDCFRVFVWCAACVAAACQAQGLVYRFVAVGLIAYTEAYTARKLSATMTAPTSPLVLVVDDDPDLRELLCTYLGANGFEVQTASDGVAMRAAIAQGAPDAIVLDLMLPGEDGLSLTRGLRTHTAVPILMLSARGEEMDRVIGLEVGADDYLAKPFGPRELLARLRALLRRGNATPPAVDEGYAQFGPFSLDIAGRRLLREGEAVQVTSGEFDLLAAFVAHPKRVLSRDLLVDLLRGYERDPFDRSIDNRVTRLRRKIEVDASAPAYIRTVRGEGYLFNPQGGFP